MYARNNLVGAYAISVSLSTSAKKFRVGADISAKKNSGAYAISVRLNVNAKNILRRRLRSKQKREKKLLGAMSVAASATKNFCDFKLLF